MPEREELVALLAAATKTDERGRKTLACARALAIAERQGVTAKEIGLICDESEVRIVGCQLGCFK